MPTASTSQILGNNEAFEPYTSNIYTDAYCLRIHRGKQAFIERSSRIRLWNETLKQELMHNGSRFKYTTGLERIVQNSLGNVYERYYRHVTSAWVFCRSITIIEFVYANANYSKLTSMHFYAWQSGLKTGMYYLQKLR
jgi:ribonucleoside-diphosphate reductase alpha chain